MNRSSAALIKWSWERTFPYGNCGFLKLWKFILKEYTQRSTGLFLILIKIKQYPKIIGNTSKMPACHLFNIMCIWGKGCVQVPILTLIFSLLQILWKKSWCIFSSAFRMRPKVRCQRLQIYVAVFYLIASRIFRY